MNYTDDIELGGLNSMTKKKNEDVQHWEVFEQGEVALDPDTFDGVDKHVNGPTKVLKLTDGNSRSLMITTEQQTEKNTWIPWIALGLTLITQAVVFLAQFTVTSDKAQRVPVIQDTVVQIDKKLARFEEKFKIVDESAKRIEEIRQRMVQVEHHLTSLKGVLNDVDSLKASTMEFKNQLTEITAQIERLTIEQDSIRDAISKAGDDRFRGKDWEKEKAALDKERQADLRDIYDRFHNMSNNIQEIKNIIYNLERKIPTGGGTIEIRKAN